MKTLTINACVAFALLLAGCSKEHDLIKSDAGTDGLKKTSKTFYGPTQQLGNGTARAWTTFNEDGVPVEVGVSISESAMNSLPDHHADLSLAFHPVKNSGTYTHVFLNWGPEGHEPPGVYDLPHFDVHFYTQSEAARMAIGPMNTAEFENYPAPMYMPELHIPVGDVPQMGNHWINLLSPELSGATFTNTFIYGSYDGAVTFYEPMVTRDWWMAQTNTVVPVATPQAYQQDGYYPYAYYVSHTSNPGTYSIALKLNYHSGQ